MSVQEVSTAVPEFYLGSLELYVFRHCHHQATTLLPVNLDVFCELNPEASTELHNPMQNSHFHRASENGLAILPENPLSQPIA
jgi:hypothetical protein